MEAEEQVQGPGRSLEKIADAAAEAGTPGACSAGIRTRGLDATLGSGGPFTVFAPAEAAFAERVEIRLHDRLGPESRAEPPEVPTYHVPPGGWTAAEILRSRPARTGRGTGRRSASAATRCTSAARRPSRPTSPPTTASSTCSTPWRSPAEVRGHGVVGTSGLRRAD
jgi:uncharacterized surface protein with fasciclin (FAS1) repeats